LAVSSLNVELTSWSLPGKKKIMLSVDFSTKDAITGRSTFFLSHTLFQSLKNSFPSWLDLCVPKELEEVQEENGKIFRWIQFRVSFLTFLIVNFFPLKCTNCRRPLDYQSSGTHLFPDRLENENNEEDGKNLNNILSPPPPPFFFLGVCVCADAHVIAAQEEPGIGLRRRNVSQNVYKKAEGLQRVREVQGTKGREKKRK
jgi:hypothetical protein